MNALNHVTDFSIFTNFVDPFWPRVDSKLKLKNLKNLVEFLVEYISTEKSSPVWGTLYDRFTPRFPVKILVIIGLLFCFFGNFLYVIQRNRFATLIMYHRQSTIDQSWIMSQHWVITCDSEFPTPRFESYSDGKSMDNPLWPNGFRLWNWYGRCSPRNNKKITHGILDQPRPTS